MHNMLYNHQKTEALNLRGANYINVSQTQAQSSSKLRVCSPRQFSFDHRYVLY